MIIAVDGPAASGKGTLARRLAEHYGLYHMDTGILYRGFAALALQHAVDPDDERALCVLAREKLKEDWYQPFFSESVAAGALKSEYIGRAASCVARHPGVRSFLYNVQRKIVMDGNCVLDGRDIASVIAPEADVKFFVTASLEVRAQRRFKELSEMGSDVSYESVQEELHERDLRDTTRACGRLEMAQDAHLLQTDTLTLEEVLQKAVEIVGQL